MPHTNVRTLNCFTNLAGNQALFGFTHSHFINIPESSHSILANCTCACLCVYAFTKRLFIRLLSLWCAVSLCCALLCASKPKCNALPYLSNAVIQRKKIKHNNQEHALTTPFTVPPPSFCYFFHIRNQKYV